MSTLLCVCLISLFFSQVQTNSKYIFLFKTIWKHVVLLLMWKAYFLFHFKVTSTWHICFSENNLHVRRQVSNSITQKPQVFFLINYKHIKISWNLFISLHLHFFFLFLQWRIYLDLYKSKKLNWCQSKHSFIFMKSECRFDCFFLFRIAMNKIQHVWLLHIFFFTSKQIFFFLINFLLLFFWWK